jgi:endonuclease III
LIKMKTEGTTKNDGKRVPPPDVRVIIKRLKKTYPDPAVALRYDKPFQLLIAVILSAQCTDVRVNMVTAELFKKYKRPEDYLAVTQEELETDIRPTGFFRNKARNIRACCKALIEKHNGVVPDSMEELIKLPGVGRKTANCILGEAYGKASGIVVDTHVTRLAQRLALSRHEDAIKIEADLMGIVPKNYWIEFGNWLIYHGRQVCYARKPRCPECILRDVCPSAEIFISSGSVRVLDNR